MPETTTRPIEKRLAAPAPVAVSNGNNPVTMAAFLASLNYNAWILPALLVVPTLGALLVWAHGAVAGQGEAAAMTARRLTLAVLVIEFVLSIGLWWSLDIASADWQAVFDVPWIEAWGRASPSAWTDFPS